MRSHLGPLLFLSLSVWGLVEWRRSRLPVPRYVHALALLALALGAWIVWMDASSGELRRRELGLLVVLPVIAYVGFFAYSGSFRARYLRARARALPRDQLTFAVHVDVEGVDAGDSRIGVSLAEARELVRREVPSSRAVVTVVAFAPDISLGFVELLLSGDRALVDASGDGLRNAAAPAVQRPGEEEATFMTVDGGLFTVPLEDTVTREQGVQSVLHWIETGTLDQRPTWRS